MPFSWTALKSKAAGLLRRRRERGYASPQRDPLSGTVRHSARPFILFAAATLAAIYSVLGLLIINDRFEATAAAEREGENIVRIINQSYSHILQSVDSTLLTLRRAYQISPAQFDMRAWTDVSPFKAELPSNYAIVDAQGRIVSATKPAMPTTAAAVLSLDVSGRDYFYRQKVSPADTFFLSSPLKLAFSGEPAVVATRRMNAADGTFGGLVAAIIRPADLAKAAAGVDLGPDGRFGLIGLDGIVRARVIDRKPDLSVAEAPPSVGTSGRNIVSDAVLSHATRERLGKFWMPASTANDTARFVSYQVLDDFPMIAMVAVAQAEIYRHANEEAFVYWLVALLMTAAIIWAVRWSLARQRRLNHAIAQMTKAQDAMRRSQERYGRVEEAVDDGIWDWNIVSDTHHRSRRWHAILGYDAADAPDSRAQFSDFVHPDDRVAITQAVRAHLQDDRPYDLEVRLRHKDGSYRWVHTRGKALRGDDGRPVRMLGAMTDITDRKKAEAAMRESNNSLARAEAMAHLGHVKYDVKTNVYTWSDGVFRIMGKSPASFVPTWQSALDIIHPEDRPKLAAYRAVVLAGNETPPITVRSIKDEGDTITVEIWSTPVRAPDGATTGIFATIQDVTARVAAKAALTESHGNLARAERMALLGHYKIDRHTGDLIWSDGTYRIFGLSPDSFEPTWRNALELILPEDRHGLKQYRDDAMAGSEMPHATARAIRADGAIIDIEYWATPVRDGNGAIVGTFGTVQDVTARKRAEQTLARANQELESRVSQRTAELAAEMRRREQAQMTLGQMQKMEAVGQLTAGIAHDFNNLLAVIGGSLEFVDSAAARGLTAEPELIDAAMRATRRGRELVRRLLAFSRQQPLRAEATTIDQLVLDTLRLLQRTLGHGIDMVTRLDAKAAVISVDRNQMANALLNLALNARDAMPDGGQLTIATTCQPATARAVSEPPGERGEEDVCITISDTGAGMTGDTLARVYEPFFTTKPDGLGSGLGLSMVQGFVEQSGGTINIDSAPGCGTTVTIRLPRVAVPSTADETDSGGNLPANGREKTVLLVEDDADVRVVTAAQLKQLGYRVHAVAGGLEAIDLIASPANIDITLTDIVLPGGLDGIGLIKEAMRARPTMGVLCMSGYDPTQKHRKWLEVQNINFLEKPFSSKRLAQALDAALAH